MSVQLTLKVFKGSDLIASRDFDRDIIKIGRLSSANLCLDDEKVSRIHSVIEVGADGNLSIIDMGSVEGTYVNGKRVNKGALSFGDEIKVGNTTIHVSATVAAAANISQAVAEPIDLPPSAPVADVGGRLAQAVVTPAPAAAVRNGHAAHAVAAPPPPPPEALDSSFASTEKNEVVHSAPAVVTAPAPRVRAAPGAKKAAGPLGLEMRFLWGDQRVGEFFIAPGARRDFTVGSAAGVGFVMGDTKLGGPKFSVVKSDSQGFQLRFNGKMNGELVRRGETLELKRVIESGKASNDGEAYSIALEKDDFAWVDLGALTLEVSFEPVPKAVVVPFSESVDFTVLNIFLVMFFLAGLFVIAAMNQELEGDEYADELNNSDSRIAKLIIKPPEVQKNPLLEKLAAQKAEKESGEMAAKHRGDEGQMGSKTSKAKDKHAAPKGDPNNKDQARALTAKIFGGGKNGGGLSTIFGSNGLGGELKSAMGNMFGSSAGEAGGFGGMGLRGSAGSGGGGVGSTIGIGAIGTKGRGGGTGTYGNGVGVLGGKKETDIGITSSEPEVQGSLDKELIRQVIHRNRGQIRYCYETQLPRFPKLNGKVAVKFVISGMGSVASSNSAQNTTGNDELAQCVASRVRTWVFPKPKGGGVVVVTYPFIFKQAGE